GKADANRLQQEFFEDESRFLQIQAMKVNVRLYGKTARTQIIQIQTAVGMNRSFDILRRLLDLDIAVSHKVLKCSKRILFFILKLDLDRWAVVQRHGTPPERLYIPHGELEQFVVRQSIRKRTNGNVL